MSVYFVLFFTVFPSLSLMGINISVLISMALVLYISLYKGKTNLVFSQLVFIFIMLFLYLFVSLFSSFINGVLDISFMKFIIIDLLSLINVYAIMCLHRITVNEVLRKFVNIIVFQVLLGVVFYFLPDLGLMLNGIFVKDPTAFKIILIVLTQLPNRLVGLGFAFFGASTLIITALLVTAHLYNVERKGKELLKLFILIFIGFFYGRTVIIGVFLILFLLPLKGTAKIIILLMIALIPVSGALEQYNPTLYKWAFEIFFNLVQGKIGNGSTDGMVAFYQIVPDNLKSWLIGDGLFSDGVGGYYMGTDIGHIRQIFYIGLLGWFTLFTYKVLLYVKAFLGTENISLRKLIFLIFVSDFILNLKGITNLNYIIFMILLAQITSKLRRKNLTD